jgi:hypothetical protein
MRTALLLLALSQASIPPNGVTPNQPLPLREYAPCGADRAVLHVLMPDGEQMDAMRVQWIYQPDSLQIVGYEPRLFCSGMD